MKNLINQIRKIDNSVDLNAVINAVKLQQKFVSSLVAAEKKAVLSEGMDVMVNGRKGVQEGTITRMKLKRAIVDIDGRSWDCPLSILEVA